jgi:Tol biopolymer transport system component
MRVPAAGGAAETICAAAGQYRGASWNDDNVIVFSMNGEVYQVSAAGGVPVKLTLVSAGASQWESPRFLPDGVHFLILARTGSEEARGVYVASLDGDPPVRVASVGTRVQFAAPDQLLFIRDGALFAQTLDLRRWSLTGEPVRIADDVGANQANGASGFDVSSTGVLVTRSLGTAGLDQVRWYARDGKPLATMGDPAPIHEVALSRDGRRIAFSANVGLGRTRDIWTIDLASNITSRLTADTGGVTGVLWSPDSRALTYTKQTGANMIRTKTVGAAADSLVLELGDPVTYLQDYSPDGQTLLMHRRDTLMALPLTGERKPVVLAAISGVDEVRFSPDGKRVSYGSDESGTWQAYVADYPSLENRRQVSATGGRQPRWRRDGKELYFITHDGKVMVAAARQGSDGEFQAPTLLFQSPLQSASAVIDQWDVTADGQRFLFMVPIERPDGGAFPLNVVLNWTNALKRK